MLLAGLLYLGSGLGLGVSRRLLARSGVARARARSRRRLWLLLAVGFGGALGPLLLMSGLARTPAGSASLLFNLEAVLSGATGVDRIPREHRSAGGARYGADRGWRGAARPRGRATGNAGLGGGAPLVALACLCWALDNNFTRKVSASDAMFIAALKGLVAGVINTGMALMLGERLPAAGGLAGIAGLAGQWGWDCRIRRESGGVRAGPARARCRAYGRLFSTGALPGCRHRDPGLWRAPFARYSGRRRS